MSRIRKSISLLLLTLWLPATLHCGLEAAELSGFFSCAGEQDECCDAGSDACNIIEGSFTRPSREELAAPLVLPSPGQPATLISSAPARLLEPPPWSISVHTAAPPEPGRARILRTHAARPPRAP